MATYPLPSRYQGRNQNGYIKLSSIHGAENDRTNAWFCLDIGIAWPLDDNCHHPRHSLWHLLQYRLWYILQYKYGAGGALMAKFCYALRGLLGLFAMLGQGMRGWGSMHQNAVQNPNVCSDATKHM